MVKKKSQPINLLLLLGFVIFLASCLTLWHMKGSSVMNSNTKPPAKIWPYVLAKYQSTMAVIVDTSTNSDPVGILHKDSGCVSAFDNNSDGSYRIYFLTSNNTVVYCLSDTRPSPPNLFAYGDESFVLIQAGGVSGETGYPTQIAIIDPRQGKFTVIYNSQKDKGGDLPEDAAYNFTHTADGQFLNFENASSGRESNVYKVRVDLINKTIRLVQDQEIYGQCYGQVVGGGKAGDPCNARWIPARNSCVGFCGGRFVKY